MKKYNELKIKTAKRGKTFSKQQMINENGELKDILLKWKIGE